MFSSWGIHPDTQVVVYDYKNGGIAARLWWMLQYMGHEKAAVLEGGWYQWENQGAPTSSSVEVPTPSNFQANPRPELLISAEEVDQLRKDPHWNLIDSRAAARYAGKEEPIDPVAGHIPGAISMPFYGKCG